MASKLVPEFSKQIIINNTQIHYIDTGSGFPILLGHSYLWDHGMWESQIIALKQLGYRCIAPDLPGHGLSGPLSSNYTGLKDLAELHHELVLSLGITQYVIIGLSVGGMWGAHLAYNYPNEVKGLVIMDSFLGAEPEDTQARYMSLINAVGQLGFTPTLSKKISPFFFKQDPNAKLVEAYEKSLQNIEDSQVPSITAIGKMIFNREDSMYILEMLKMRGMLVEIVVGAQDIARPVSEAHQMADILGRSPIIISDAGHITAVEQPGKVSAILEHFLESVVCLA